jgi:hypothetical protein
LVEKGFSDKPASVSAPKFADIQHALLWSGAVLGAYLIVLRVWRQWDDAAMQAQVRVELPRTPIVFLTLFSMQLTLTAGLVLGSEDVDARLLAGCFIAVLVFWVVWDLTNKPRVLKPPRREDIASATYAKKATHHLSHLSKALGMGLGWGIISSYVLNAIWPARVVFGLSTLFPASAIAFIVFVAMLFRMTRAQSSRRQAAGQ